MPFLSRTLLMLAVLALSTSLQPSLALARGCSTGFASNDPRSPVTAATGCTRVSSNAADTSFLGGLQGQYAFILKGTLTAPGIASRSTVAIGSFTADGQGEIISGEMDFTSAGKTFQRLPIVGDYTLDNYGAGTLSLASTEGIQSFSFYTTGDLSSTTTYASGSLVETDDGGPVVSSGSFYQQSASYFGPQGAYGYWRVALTGETFVSAGTPDPIFVGGNLFLEVPVGGAFTSLTRRVGSGAPETINPTLLADPFPDLSGRMAFSSVGGKMNMAGYIVDGLHIIVISTDPPQINPLVSGTIVRDLIPTTL